jgi:hypothetical protein
MIAQAQHDRPLYNLHIIILHYVSRRQDLRFVEWKCAAGNIIALRFTPDPLQFLVVYTHNDFETKLRF